MSKTNLRMAATLITVISLGAMAQAPAPQIATPVEAVHGIDPANLDTKARPCEDFYQFATGGWAARNPIPPDQSRWGSFDALALRNMTQLKAILEDAAKATPSSDPVERKLGDFYAAAMDEKLAEALGAKPLAPYMERIAAIKDAKDLAALSAEFQRQGVSVFFGVGSEQDAKDATKVIAGIAQRGLGLPDRDYYLKDDPKSKAVREAYVVYMTEIFKLLGDAPETASAESRTVLRLETGLAQVSMSRVDRRNPKLTYNPMSVDQLRALSPEVPWTSYFQAAGLPGLASLDVGMPDYFKGLSAQLKSEPLSDWKTYMRWHVARSFGPLLSAPFVKAGFEFNRVMTGAQEDQPRWRKAVAATNGSLGEDLGQIYVRKYFSPEAKAQVLDILHHIRAALREDLATLSWMSEPTRRQAIAKLDKIAEKIGYPDKWRDYSSVKVDRADYLGNVVRANAFEFKRDLDKIGKPVDRTEWGMTPATVNAYYRASVNEIVFPAGILQPPFFDPQADPAVNYGGIGCVIGHEITHGFDDKGSQYDAEGNLKDWWTPEDSKAFQAKGDRIVSQASEFVVDGDLHLQGKLVEGEAIADLGGVTLSYAAYQKSLGGKAAPALGGFTGAQRFFLGYATVWAQNIRPQMARMLATIDSHPPARYRVNATLSTVPAFAAAFSCPEGCPMIHGDTSEHKIW